MACTTSSGSPYLRAISAPISAWLPSTSWVSALPMSCSTVHRLSRAGSIRSSLAIIPAMCADSTRWRSTFCP
jgi:hypothetical protein